MTEHLPKDLTLQEIRAINFVLWELRCAEQKHKGWNPDPLRGACIISEEAGEVMQAALQLVEAEETGVATDDSRWSGFKHLRKEVAQTGAMALRFLIGVYNA